MTELPEYERSLRMVERRRLATGFAKQIAITTEPALDVPFREARVVDLGCGYGYTALELAGLCREVVGIEPNGALAAEATRLAAEGGRENFTFRVQGIGDFGHGDDAGAFDVAVLDNVLEHLDDQPDALERIASCLRPGGVAYILVPNRWWPIEAHYSLPFLAWLPLPLATRYLRWSGRGSDYTDASYAPSYLRMRRLLAQRPDLDARFTVPGDVSLAEGGGSRLYSLGVAALRRFPPLWAISKAFLVVAVKKKQT
ncbi:MULTISPECIES: class I SAM-dependent methyltransferase [unclassified Pseudonocardia]|uniref:class I SAM-dependent methyltransferase n=1 Tax=unclassified Pseudonocardia TaxID=2619320 RepID=UPI001CF697B6|nr:MULTISPECIES: class I SAM-dependent methyltransferase [unclassified Pseudonocardia]